MSNAEILLEDESCQITGAMFEVYEGRYERLATTKNLERMCLERPERPVRF